MSQAPLSPEQMRRALALVQQHGTVTAAARAAGMPRQTLSHQYREARRLGVDLAKPRVRVSAGSAPHEAEPVDPSRPVFKNPPPPVAFTEPTRFQFETDGRHEFTFGALGDTHLCSKYERLDVLNDLYDHFEAEGVATVFHTGNWIDGEARFNVHDVTVHGMDAQCRYLARHYPARRGITTYAVAGDDHEGWYGQRTGVNIGAYAEKAFRDANRADWHDLGFMEAPVTLTDPASGAKATIAVVHPGGGSAYAVSYTMQKFVEALDGGEKPAIALLGHYHKLNAGNFRNIWGVQTGCTQDQTPFMRKKKIDAHIGGYIIRATMDPRTGAIVRCRFDMLRYFNRGYYGGRWSHSGDVVLPARTLGAA
ncbi:MAG TPA: hypothetical protein PLQ37_16380 [Acidiphilium sp.]|nr:hypothetical protein [Acidiphilium sp.]